MSIPKGKHHHKKRGLAGLLCTPLDLSPLCSFSYMKSHLRPYRLQLSFHGFSHGLKTCPRHVFFTAFRIPSRLKKTPPHQGWCFLWRRRRDSNPCDTFMPYEISSHASSTSLSTPPYRLAIITARNRKIKEKSRRQLDRPFAFAFDTPLPSPKCALA